ncbi:hypothetical protein DBV15_00861 [Temnothorax longispinosus]|uniref:Uncharacterized protein n=1 Tax=Temnothorax longispinosus TaxID=300112 RepID=A0A4S2KK78_9HYME|nr:hypothetical protein DBV15_00861 [Temnothorax longispinosus]
MRVRGGERERERNTLVHIEEEAATWLDVITAAAAAAAAVVAAVALLLPPPWRDLESRVPDWSEARSSFVLRLARLASYSAGALCRSPRLRGCVCATLFAQQLEAGISSPRKSPPHAAQVRKGEKDADAPRCLPVSRRRVVGRGPRSRSDDSTRWLAGTTAATRLRHHYHHRTPLALPSPFARGPTVVDMAKKRDGGCGRFRGIPSLLG